MPQLIHRYVLLSFLLILASQSDSNHFYQVTRIDLKTASHDDVVLFVKRQNKHIRELETLLDRLETRHKEYKAQLSDYAHKLEESRSLDHLQGDERLKHHIQTLQIERDALAAELQEKQHSAPPSDTTTTSPTPSSPPAPRVSNEEVEHLKKDLEAAKAKVEDTSRSSALLEKRLQATVETQKSEILKQQELVSQLNTACEALKARLTHVSSQHNTKLQAVTSEHESKLQTLNSTIVQLQHDLSKEKDVSEQTNPEPIPVAPTTDTPSTPESLSRELDDLKKQVEDLKKANEALQTSPLQVNPQPSPEEKDERAEQILKLEEKLQSKQALLVKAHKHLGELTAQLADTNLRAQQLASEKSRLESASASVAELRHRNGELQASLEEARLEFERYRVKVAAAESEKVETERSSTPASVSTPVSDVPIGLQDKIDELNAEIDKFRLANEQMRSEGELANAELTSLRAKHQTVVSHLRHYKEKETSREISSEKRQKEREIMEERHKTQMAELLGQSETQAANSAAQLSRLRLKADEAIKQRDGEISSLRDMLEVLKIQAAQSEPKRGTAAVSRAFDVSNETSRRRTSTDSGNSPSRRRPRQGDETIPESPSSRSGSLTPDVSRGTPSFDQSPREEQQSSSQVLLTRINSLQDQVSELEQLLALSREQEQFLKLELRRYDRTTGGSLPSSSAPQSRPTTPSASNRGFDMISPQDYAILRNLLKNMLETGEAPNMMVFADLLRFSAEELEQVRTRALGNTGAARVASAVETGMNAIWNVFGSPQRQ